MNCETHQQNIAQDPSYDDAHLLECDACRNYRDEMHAFEHRIEHALSLPVPELRIPSLPDLDTENIATLPARRLSVPAWLAVAATIAVVAVLGFRTLGEDTVYSSLAAEIIAHVEHEPYALAVSDRGVSDRRLSRIVPPSVATMDHSAGLITYAQSCVINGHTVPHLVLQGERGPVTILLMPEEMVDKEAEEIRGETVNGVILKVGDGSIAIIGGDGENLQRIQRSVRDSVSWST